MSTVDETVVKDIVDAWEIEGVNPQFHREQKERLRKEWGTLYYAIAKFIRVAKQK